jgi:hypothetical protein
LRAKKTRTWGGKNLGLETQGEGDIRAPRMSRLPRCRGSRVRGWAWIARPRRTCFWAMTVKRACVSRGDRGWRGGDRAV